MEQQQQAKLEELQSKEPLEFSFSVEKGKIKEFADAIFDTNDIFRKEKVASNAGFSGIPAPLTFTEIFRFERARLPEYEPDKYFDRQLALHGSQEYEYNRNPVAGETLTAQRTLKEFYSKQGSSGELIFGIFKTDYRDEEGELIVRSQKTRIIVKEGDDK
jgi:hypothetical protein